MGNMEVSDIYQIHPSDFGRIFNIHSAIYILLFTTAGFPHVGDIWSLYITCVYIYIYVVIYKNINIYVGIIILLGRIITVSQNKFQRCTIQSPDSRPEHMPRYCDHRHTTGTFLLHVCRNRERPPAEFTSNAGQ